MAQTYTLEEAANRLGVAQEELKKRIREDWKTLRSYRDGGTIRFRASDIDDLARSLGQSSDPGLQPGSKKAGAADDFLLPPGDDSSEELSLNLGDPKKTKKTGDSDIRLAESSGPKHDSDEHQITEEINIDLAGPKSKGGSGKLVAPKSGSIPGGPKSAKIPVSSNVEMSNTDSSSEFELSLDSDSDSFELDLNTGTGSGDKAPIGGKTGIKLDKPADRGKSLDSDDSMEFELSLDSSDELPAMKKRDNKKKNTTVDSDSEFELTLDENSGITEGIAADLQSEEGDIHETNFDLPSVDESESEVVAVDDVEQVENSDFDLALDESDVQVEEEDESASQVVLIDEEEEEQAPVAKAGGRTKALAGAAVAGAAAVGAAAYAGSESASRALSGVDDDEEASVRVIQAPAAKWGVMPAIMGLLTLVFVTVGSLMGYELMRTMPGYNSSTRTTGPIIKGIAGMFGMAPNETLQK